MIAIHEVTKRDVCDPPVVPAESEIGLVVPLGSTCTVSRARADPLAQWTTLVTSSRSVRDNGHWQGELILIFESSTLCRFHGDLLAWTAVCQSVVQPRISRKCPGKYMCLA